MSVAKVIFCEIDRGGGRTKGSMYESLDGPAERWCGKTRGISYSSGGISRANGNLMENRPPPLLGLLTISSVAHDDDHINLAGVSSSGLISGGGGGGGGGGLLRPLLTRLGRSTFEYKRGIKLVSCSLVSA